MVAQPQVSHRASAICPLLTSPAPFRFMKPFTVFGLFFPPRRSGRSRSNIENHYSCDLLDAWDLCHRTLSTCRVADFFPSDNIRIVWCRFCIRHNVVSSICSAYLLMNTHSSMIGRMPEEDHAVAEAHRCEPIEACGVVGLRGTVEVAASRLNQPTRCHFAQSICSSSKC